MGKRGPKEMTDDHKAAMELGRLESRVVKTYLEAIRSTRPKRGRRRTAEGIKKRLEEIEQEMLEASVIAELQLVQERRNLEAELESSDVDVDISELEDEFVEVAKAYGDRKGITYRSWRDVGVPAGVLQRAGISRAS